MNAVETVEQLTCVIAKQARVINGLYALVQQLNATTSLTEDIIAVQKEAARFVDGPED